MFKASLVVALGVVLGTLGFAVEATADDADRLKSSLKSWESVKKQCGGNYEYIVLWSSFNGQGHRTVVKVENNEVVERSFYTFGGPVGDCGKDPNAAQWVETAKEKNLNSHDGAAEALTVDELYERAKGVCAMELKEGHKRTLTFDKRGVLSGCYMMDTRIADDAPRVGVEPFDLTLNKAK
jgi:hypothetical protein